MSQGTILQEERQLEKKIDSISIAARGNEITGLDIFDQTSEDFDLSRVQELIAAMNKDQPTGGVDLAYGEYPEQTLRFWRPESSIAPLILFVHGGSWQSGTNLDSIGALKVEHLVSKGYAFASVNYRLVPFVTVEEQVQDVADSLAYLIRNAADLSIDLTRVILMGHSSGAHVATLLGTDVDYVTRAGVDIHNIRGVVSLDGSNYNAMAELLDSPGSVADNTIKGIGSDISRLRNLSPTYKARGANAHRFLLLHIQRQGDIRQAVEFAAALEAADTAADLHVFEGEGFEGHVQMLLRLGDPSYPATAVMDRWLERHCPVS